MLKKTQALLLVGMFSLVSVSIVLADKDQENDNNNENAISFTLEKKIEEFKSETIKKIEEKKTQNEQKTEKIKKQDEKTVQEIAKTVQKSETTIAQNKQEPKKVDIITKTEPTVKKVEYYVTPTKKEKENPSETKQEEIKSQEVTSEKIQSTDTKQKEDQSREIKKEERASSASSVIIPTYVGTAEKKDDGDFKLTVDANDTLPNGSYDLKTKLYQEDGTIIEGKKKTIAIENPVQTITLEDKKKFKNSEADTDSDGVPDKEEIRLNTNPLLADSDGDGFLDGDELKNGFNPLIFSPGDKSDKVAFESPKKGETIVKNVTENGVSTPVEETKQVITETRFAVNTIQIVTVTNADTKNGDTKNTDAVKKESTKKTTRFSGKALPNIFVTLYIFSDPIVVTVKTDADGNWSYDLDKEIPDGNHEVYVAVTDNVGKITSQSRALPFVKTADAIAIQPAQASATETAENATPLEKSKTQLWFTVFVIMTSCIGVALVFIGRRSSFIK
ncbi:MAG: Ig-like domain-containing protein [Candidatus Moranbacteria bacterium]|nr:Ig-like domain-containing protein [Candidatus Moranbacteria bacterium]MDD3964718.1 Ig-like domain-containing protein [Candidatus Moranbacteria bacterium]